jgi:hypothetical protein
MMYKSADFLWISEKISPVNCQLNIKSSHWSPRSKSQAHPIEVIRVQFWESSSCLKAILLGGWGLPLWKMMEWVRQLGFYEIPIFLMESHSKFHGSSHHQPAEYVRTHDLFIAPLQLQCATSPLKPPEEVLWEVTGGFPKWGTPKSSNIGWWSMGQAMVLGTRPGQRLHNYGTSPCYQWVNALFLWPCSTAMLNYKDMIYP